MSVVHASASSLFLSILYIPAIANSDAAIATPMDTVMRDRLTPHCMTNPGVISSFVDVFSMAGFAAKTEVGDATIAVTNIDMNPLWSLFNDFSFWLFPDNWS